jgi:hypothetical protein
MPEFWTNDYAHCSPLLKPEVWTEHLRLENSARWGLAQRKNCYTGSLSTNAILGPGIKLYPEHFPKPLNPLAGQPFAAFHFLRQA